MNKFIINFIGESRSENILIKLIIYYNRNKHFKIKLI